jgi:hypothetical protein
VYLHKRAIDGIMVVEGGEALRLQKERSVKIDSNQLVGPMAVYRVSAPAVPKPDRRSRLWRRHVSSRIPVA